MILIVCCNDEPSHTVPLNDECDGLNPQYCCDKDGDGYGVGFIGACIHAREDFNDYCITCNPGALERCDDYDNNGNGINNEDVSCESSYDCPQSTYGLNAIWVCENSVCSLYDCESEENCNKNKYLCVDNELRIDK